MLRFLLRKLIPPTPEVLSSKLSAEDTEQMKKVIIRRINLQRKTKAIPFPDKELPSPVSRRHWMDQLYSSQIEHLLESMGVSNGQGRSLC